jgi:hypothetical protein
VPIFVVTSIMHLEWVPKSWLWSPCLLSQSPPYSAVPLCACLGSHHPVPPRGHHPFAQLPTSFAIPSLRSSSTLSKPTREQVLQA